MARVSSKHISDDDYTKLLAHCDASAELPELMVSLLARVGMRGDELLKLTAQSFDFKRCMVFVDASKNGNARWIKVRPELMDRARAWIPYLQERGTFGLMLSDSSNLKSQKRTMIRWIDQVYQAALGEHNYTVHSLRHTFCLKSYLGFGKDLLKTQLVMGHKSMNSTVAYLKYLELEDCHDDVIKAVG